MMNAEKKKPGCLTQFVGASVVMGLVGWLIISTDQDSRNETPEIRREKFCGDQGKSNADIAAKFYVKEDLKAPSTAKFSGYDARNITLISECEFVVRGYVDAQNSFGAMIRNNYYVRIRYDPVKGLHMPVNIQIGR